VKFYQATERDYKKIVDWFNQEREKGATCVDRFGKATTVRELKEFVESKQGFEIFVCEDDEGRIRVVAGRERRGAEWNPNEPEASVYGFEAICYDDYIEENFTYRIALWRWILRFNIDRGIKISELWVPEKAIPLAQKLLGEAFTIKRVEEELEGRPHLITIDLTKEIPFLVEDY